MTLVFIILSVAFALLGAAVLYGNRRQLHASFIDDYVFPPGVRAKVRKRYPHLTEADADRVLNGLRQYFHLSNLAGRRVLAMPSQVVDVAWHEFILFTRNYQAFCQRALGRFLHHTPAAAMASPTLAQEGIRRAWRLACAREGIDPRAPGRLPLLFALDAELDIADGLRFVPDCLRAGASAPGHHNAGVTYCGSHIGCGSGAGDGGCTGGDGGGCGGGGD